MCFNNSLTSSCLVHIHSFTLFLLTVQTLERYLLARGFGKVGDPGARGARRMDDE